MSLIRGITTSLTRPSRSSQHVQVAAAVATAEWARRWAWQDESSMCISAFRVLKQTITNWLTDLRRTRDFRADLLLHNVYRWLRAPGAMMHDPALHTVVHSIMRKVLMLLLASLKEMGCKVFLSHSFISSLIRAAFRSFLPISNALSSILAKLVWKKPSSTCPAYDSHFARTNCSSSWVYANHACGVYSFSLTMPTSLVS